MAKHTIQELQQWQMLPLSVKVNMTKQRIRDWVNEYGEDGVYVAFSGGKDSTVLLDIAREMYPNLKAMFVDIPTQYPELKKFAETFENVDYTRPQMNFFQVCEKYGFPLISKEASECIEGARKYLTKLIEENASLTDRQTDRQTDRHPYAQFYRKLQGIGEYQKKVPIRVEQTMRTRQVCSGIRGGVRFEVS